VQHPPLRNVVPNHAALAKGRTRKRHVPPWRFPFIDDAGRCDPADGGTPSALAENALDVADGCPIDLGDLGNRYAVLHQGADMPEL
jgi:hypothetical protein